MEAKLHFNVRPGVRILGSSGRNTNNGLCSEWADSWFLAPAAVCSCEVSLCVHALRGLHFCGCVRLALTMYVGGGDGGDRR